jgi:tRNA (guanine37-N1)-methyltransferase
MDFHVVTLFPEMFRSAFEGGPIGRALAEGKVSISAHQLRDFGLGNYRQVDDTPYGGGAGMVMRPEPIAAAIDHLNRSHPGLFRILLTPQGQRLDQGAVRSLALHRPGLMLIAGRYEGFDERIRSLVDCEISIGDYVLNGGEIPALVVIDAVARLLPGVLGNPASLKEESFSSAALEYPQYTRPEEFRGMRVPQVLLSGNHELVRRWRATQARERTSLRRPDLIARTKA